MAAIWRGDRALPSISMQASKSANASRKSPLATDCSPLLNALSDRRSGMESSALEYRPGGAWFKPRAARRQRSCRKVRRRAQDRTAGGSALVDRVHELLVDGDLPLGAEPARHGAQQTVPFLLEQGVPSRVLLRVE